MEYRQIVQDKGGFIRWGKSLDIDGAPRERMDARADALAWVANKLNDYSFDARVKKEMELLKPEIIGKMPPEGGILVCVIYTQSVDFGYKSFDNMYVANAGKDMRLVMADESRKSKIGARVHSAFQKKEMYIWVTNQNINEPI